MSLSTTTPSVALPVIRGSLNEAANLETVVQDEFRSIQQVENVSVDYEDNAVFVWIAVNDPVQLLRHEIYAKQMNVIEAFPEVPFDFNLISVT